MRLALVSRRGSIGKDIITAIESLGYTVVEVIVESLHPRVVAETLRGVEYDYAIVPGLSPFDYSGLKNVVKGTISPKLLPLILRHVRPDALSSSVSAERVTPEDVMADIYFKLFHEISANVEWLKAGRVRIPLRPPPLIVFSDIYIKASVSRDDLLREVHYRSRLGADAIVLSFDPLIEDSEITEIVSRIIEDSPIPVAIDTPKMNIMLDAIREGASIGFSLTPDKLKDIPSTMRDAAFYVVIPRSISDYRARVEELAKACETATELGVNVILDPVVQPLVYPGSLDSLIAARLLSSKYCREYPLMLGINNAVELADIDTHASTATLTLLAAETGASIVMVGEESFKARGSTLEAKIASVMASIAMILKTPPKDMPLDLLYFKQKTPPPGVKYLGSGIYDIHGSIVNCISEAVSELCRPWVIKSTVWSLIREYSKLFRLSSRD